MRDLGAIQTTIPGDHRGMIREGNINLRGRPVVRNRDGSISTVHSFSIGSPQGEVLIPQVVHGRLVSKREAVRHYYRTGEHLGVFVNPRTADRYAVRLHNEQARTYARSA